MIVARGTRPEIVEDLERKERKVFKRVQYMNYITDHNILNFCSPESEVIKMEVRKWKVIILASRKEKKLILAYKKVIQGRKCSISFWKARKLKKVKKVQKSNLLKHLEHRHTK